MCADNAGSSRAPNFSVVGHRVRALYRRLRRQVGLDPPFTYPFTASQLPEQVKIYVSVSASWWSL